MCCFLIQFLEDSLSYGLFFLKSLNFITQQLCVKKFYCEMDKSQVTMFVDTPQKNTVGIQYSKPHQGLERNRHRYSYSGCSSQMSLRYNTRTDDNNTQFMCALFWEILNNFIMYKHLAQMEFLWKFQQQTESTHKQKIEKALFGVPHRCLQLFISL